MSRPLRWQVGLLLLFPPLSLLYLWGVQVQRVRPGFGPVLGLAALPLAASVLGLVALRRTREGVRRQVILLAAALAEILWALCALAMVGFAIAGRSG
jgi:hypothetical protein